MSDYTLTILFVNGVMSGGGATGLHDRANKPSASMLAEKWRRHGLLLASNTCLSITLPRGTERDVEHSGSEAFLH